MKSFSLYTFLLVFAFSLSACKSSEIATDSMGNGMATAEETTMDAMDKAADVVSDYTADQLIAQNFEARGGKENIKAIQSMSWEAGMEMMGMSMPLTMKMKRPNKIRTDVEVSAMNTTIIQAFDGSTAWQINPMGGSTEAQKMTGEEAKQIKDNASLDGTLITYIEKGYDMSYEGEGTVNDKPAHKIKVMLPEDKVTTVYLDKETLYEVMTEQEGINPMTGASGTVATYTSDYKEVGGVMMPHKIVAKFNGELLQELVINVIEINQDIPDSEFQMPGMGGSMN